MKMHQKNKKYNMTILEQCFLEKKFTNKFQEIIDLAYSHKPNRITEKNRIEKCNGKVERIKKNGKESI